jgi:hypothetical protein
MYFSTVTGIKYMTSGKNMAPAGVDPSGFIWRSTGQVVSYTNWYPGQPNRNSGFEGQDLHIVALKKYNWLWIVMMNATMPFVCKYIPN